jgi:hypothetical protein
MQDSLYVIQSATGRFKVGRSHTPRERIARIGAHHFARIDVVSIVLGAGPEEARVHNRLVCHRDKGEWFCDTPKARATLADALPGVLLTWRGRPQRKDYAPDPSNEWDRALWPEETAVR